jgi:hypothetical protein
MSEYYVKSNHAIRRDILPEIQRLGTVTDKWSDGTFKFRCNDPESEEEFRDTLETYGVDCQLI